MTHVFLALENPEYARLYSERDREAAEFLVSGQESRNRAALDKMIRERAARLQSMYDKIEGPAEAAKLEIWRELRSGHRKGARASGGLDTGWMITLKDLSRSN